MNLVKSVLIGFFVMCAWAPTAQAVRCDECEDQYLIDTQECFFERKDCLKSAKKLYEPAIAMAKEICEAGSLSSSSDALVCAAYWFLVYSYEVAKETCQDEWARCDRRACDREKECKRDCDPYEDT